MTDLLTAIRNATDAIIYREIKTKRPVSPLVYRQHLVQDTLRVWEDRELDAEIRPAAIAIALAVATERGSSFPEIWAKANWRGYQTMALSALSEARAWRRRQLGQIAARLAPKKFVSKKSPR